MSVKRIFKVKSLGEKCQALKDIKSGISIKEVGKIYGVPKNTISTSSKNKTSYFAALEQFSE